MYTTENFRTAKALREAVKAGERVTYFEPGIGRGQEPSEGTIVIEGPHHPEAHKFYLRCKVENGVIVKVL